jgi:hypothetical protein
MLNEIVTTTFAALSTGLAGYLVYILKSNREEKKNDNNAMKILMRRELKELHAECMKQGYTTAEQLGEFREIHATYHAYHGNGTGDVWLDDMEHLERRD